VGGGIAETAISDDSETMISDAPLGVVAEAPADVEVDTLDFRKVGIQAWKVKVKIGLVYDFSDYRTLARYIAEGRVTASDKLSHNGSDWMEISQIPDLAAYFVATYRRLELELAAEEEDVPEDFEDDEPTNIMGMGGEAFADSASHAVSLTSFSSSAAPRILPSDGKAGGVGTDLQSAMSAALDAEDGETPKAPVGPRFIDPFEKRKSGGRSSKGRSGGGASGGARSRPKPRKQSQSGKDSSGGSNRSGVFGLVVVLALGGGAAWWFSNQAEAPATSAVRVTAPAALQSGQGDRSRKDIRREIEEEILTGTEVEETPGEAIPEEEEAWGGEDDSPKLIPVGPRDTPRAGGGSKTPGPSSAPTRSAREYAADGDSAMRRRDYGNAISSFQKAVGAEPSNSQYNGQLGAAMVRNGQMESAMDPLMRAASGGYSPAFVSLGDIAASRGDTAGAIGYYQSYLATNPRDAAAVQAKIARLSG
jgi:hypothetical protein